MNRTLLSLFALTLFISETRAQNALQLRGLVTDPSGAAIPGAAVTLTGTDNFTKSIQAGADGSYALTGLRSGKFTLRATSTGFANFERIVNIGGDRPINFDITLKLAIETQQITVSDTAEINLDPSDPTKNVGALVLKTEDLQALSDNPDDLQSDLQALAGPAVGPNGGQLFIDGFSGGRLPPKESIREVRINSNPFSAEYDKVGFGRIEVLTKPGTDKFRGVAFFNFTDAIFNSRNPFVDTRPPYQQKFFGGNLSGPVTKKSSFFVEIDRRNQDEVTAINAVTPDPITGQPSPFKDTVPNPQTRTNINPRFDYQINANNTLVARYEWSKRESQNYGLSSLTLPSRALDYGETEHTLQLTETSVISPKAINETRFQYSWERVNQQGDSSTPSINVPDQFQGGGATMGLAYNNENSWELTNITSITHGSHMLKVGGRVRGIRVDDYTTRNYNATWNFRTIADYDLGIPNQFSLTSGNPLAGVDQYDLGVFITDDWRIKPNFTLSTGLRYENQTNISSKLNFAPRIGFAWGIGKPGRTGGPKTVIRGGWGIFYDRFDESYTLQAYRLNGSLQQQFIVRDPIFYPVIPTPQELEPFRQAQTIQQVYSGLKAPYIMQTAIGVERQLPRNITLAVNYSNSRGVHMLRQRNINAPLPGTYDPTDPTSGIRPYGNEAGNLYMYESSGLFKQNQLIVNSRAPINSRINLFGFYMLNYARANTDGVGTFPASTYDLAAEWGRAQFDVRHRGVIGGSITTWRGISFNPFVMAQTGGPYNVTLGPDLNGDTLFTERPAFATSSTPSQNIVVTPLGVFNINPGPNDVIIPRNYGQAPGLVTVNLRASKTWGWGERTGSASADGPRGPRGGGFGGVPGGGGRGMRMGGPGGGGMFGGGSSGKKYSLTFSVSARNLFNHVNPGMPLGTLTSPLFGQSNSLAGGGFGPGGGGGGGGAANVTSNRRIDLQLRFSF